MHYFADKVTQRLQKWQARNSRRTSDDLECASDDDDRTPRQSFSTPIAMPESTGVEADRSQEEQDQMELDKYERGLQAMAAQEEQRGRRPEVSIPPQASSSSTGSRDWVPPTAVTEDRKDSTAAEVKPLLSCEEWLQTRTQQEADPAFRDLEWTPPPSYYNVTANTFLPTSEDVAVRMRDERDNASISTSSSQRARIGFGLNGSDGRWKPFQSKSTASVGFSAAQNVIGKLSLREAVSPTRKARSSAQELFAPETSKAAAQVPQEDASVRERKVLASGSTLPRKGILKSKSGETPSEEQSGQTSWEKRRAQLNKELDLTPLTPRDVQESASKKAASPSRPKPQLAPDLATSSTHPHVTASTPKAASKENSLPHERHAQSAEPDSSTQSPESSKQVPENSKRSWKHKRSDAVDLTGVMKTNNK